MALIANIQTCIVYIRTSSTPTQTRKLAGSQNRALYSEYSTEDTTSVSCELRILQEDYRQ